MKHKLKKVLKWTAITVGGFAAIAYSVVAVSVFIAVANQSEQDSKPLSVEQMQEKITPDALFIAINEIRTENGLEQLKRNSLLDKSASLKCEDMRDGGYYGHANPITGKSGYTYVQDVGQSAAYMGENLNAGIFSNAREVMGNWMLSEPHKEAILNSKYTETGFAACANSEFPDGLVFVNHFVEPLPN